MVDEIVRLTQLRPAQVLFVDDNARIRAEIGSTCGVATATPEEMDCVDAATIPSDVGSTEEFLRRCEIRVGRHDAGAWKERSSNWHTVPTS